MTEELLHTPTEHQVDDLTAYEQGLAMVWNLEIVCPELKYNRITNV